MSSLRKLFFVVLVALTMSPLQGQNLRVTDLRLDDTGRLRLTFNADTNHYYLLLQGSSVTDIRQPAAISLASPDAPTLSLTHLPPSSPAFKVPSRPQHCSPR